jgi:hypothetical protein
MNRQVHGAFRKSLPHQPTTLGSQEDSWEGKEDLPLLGRGPHNPTRPAWRASHGCGFTRRIGSLKEWAQPQASFQPSLLRGKSHWPCHSGLLSPLSTMICVLYPNRGLGPYTGKVNCGIHTSPRRNYLRLGITLSGLFNFREGCLPSKLPTGADRPYKFPALTGNLRRCCVHRVRKEGAVQY